MGDVVPIKSPPKISFRGKYWNDELEKAERNYAQDRTELNLFALQNVERGLSQWWDVAGRFEAYGPEGVRPPRDRS